MYNLIISNAAGTFSTILKYISWMCVQEKNRDTINLFFDFRNKTKVSGNTLLNYGTSDLNLINFSQTSENIFDMFFNIKNVGLYPYNSKYVEQYPYEIKNIIKNYPEHLIKYEGRGCDVKQYFDDSEIKKIRSEFNKQWERLDLSPNLKKRINVEVDPFFRNNHRILCAMIRYSDHYVGDFSYEKIFEEIDDKMKNFDKLLLITQLLPVVEILKEKYGNNLIYFENRHRVNDYKTDWDGGRNISMSDESFIRETEDCIIDVIAASKSHFVLGGASNMFLGALSINKDLNYKIFDVLINNIGR
jgi:hypothetical protein